LNISLNPHDLLFLLAPGLIAILTRPAWSGYAKFLLAVAVCFAAALLEILITGQAGAASLGLALGKAFGLTMTAYAGVWKILLPVELKALETQVNVGPGAGQ